MSLNLILKVFIGFILFLSFRNVYQSGIDIIIQYFIEQESIEYIQSKYCLDYLKVEDECPKHRYIIRMIERSPLIIYIEKFLNQNEIDHLIKLAEPLFKPSLTYNSNGSSTIDERRTSTSAYINRQQTPIVKCLEQRFARFQGDIDLKCLEPFQIVKYTDDQEYKPHYDWFSHSNPLKNGGQRVTTFFSYLQSNCSEGGTEFVDIRFNKSLHQRFCDILICDDKSSEYGIRFRPLTGNTIFWYNMDEYAQVDYLTYHAGHPPGKNGIKIGLNTWTREAPFNWPYQK